MAWTPALGGIFKARLLAIQSMIQDKIDDLNDALAADSDLAYLVGSTFGGDLTEDVVVIGDSYATWVKTTGCLRFCICAGNHRDGVTANTTRAFIDATPTRGHRFDVFTAIYFYYHHESFVNEDPVEQAFIREKARELVNDWLVFDVFHDPANLAIELTTQCVAEGSEFDTLDFSLAENVYKGVYIRGNSNLEHYGGEIRHHAMIE